MQRKFYLDTAIWMDYFGARGNGIRPLGDLAFQLLKKCREDNSQIIVSDAVTEELEASLSKAEIEAMFSGFAGLIARVWRTKEQAVEAFALRRKLGSEFPLYDILHSIIARDEKAVLVARDRHFWEIGIAEVCLPEDLL
ncbi:MAG: PIN domain-containing protein [Candidatus Diapherotrites archaeon]